MALRIAHRYRNRGIEVEDLEQVALLALIKAVRRFEPGRGRAFAAYAAPSIAGDLKKHFRDHGWGVRPPRAIQELVLSVRSTASDLSQTLHHEPTVAEVAEELQVESDDVAQAMIATQNFTPVSLDAPAPGSEVPVGDLIVDETDEYARVEVISQLRPAIAGLSARDRMILHMRFIDACTQSEIGTALGISQMQVSRRLTSILHQLRSQLQEPPQQDALAGGVPRLTAGPARPSAGPCGSARLRPAARLTARRCGPTGPARPPATARTPRRCGPGTSSRLQPLTCGNACRSSSASALGDVRTPLRRAGPPAARSGRPARPPPAAGAPAGSWRRSGRPRPPSRR